MSGKTCRLLASLAGVMLLLPAIPTTGALAAPGIQAPAGVTPGVQDRTGGTEKQKTDEMEWNTGFITQPPHTSVKTKQLMIFIDKVPYVLSKNIVIIEIFEQTPEAGPSERVAGLAVLGRGKEVSYQIFKSDPTLITKAVINSIPKRD